MNWQISLFTFSLIVMSASSAFSQSSNDYFPIHGGITLGELRPLDFEEVPNSRLESSLFDVFELGGFNFTPGWSPHDVNYAYSLLDTNGDGNKEAIVYMLHPMGTGSGGYHTWFFRDRGNRYEFIGQLLHHVWLVFEEPTNTFESNVILVPGSIERFPDRSFYRRCTLPNNAPSFYVYDSNMPSCSQIAHGSIISGISSRFPELQGTHVHTLYASNPQVPLPEICEDLYISSSSQFKQVDLPEIGINLEIPDNYQVAQLSNGSYRVINGNDFNLSACVERGGRARAREIFSFRISQLPNSNTQTLNSILHSRNPSSPFFQGRVSQHSHNGLNSLIIEAPSRRTVGAWFQVPSSEAVVMIEVDCDCELNATDIIRALDSVRIL